MTTTFRNTIDRDKKNEQAMETIVLVRMNKTGRLNRVLFSRRMSFECHEREQNVRVDEISLIIRQHSRQCIEITIVCLARKNHRMT
jgi:hypothetical protein